MDFWIHFYCLLVFLTSQILAFNTKYKLPSASSLTPDDKALGILKKTYLDFERATGTVHEASSGLPIENNTALSNAQERLDRKQHFSWWPSKVDYSDTINEILEPDSAESLVRDVDKPPATFEELEKHNGNIYNPLLNQDPHPIPSKKYTFEELENMNANRYNPYLN